MKKLLTFLSLLPLLTLQAQTWEAPTIPAEDIKSIKSTLVGYLWNIESDAFLINGMNSNVSACATRLTNGDITASNPQRCALFANDSTVKIRLRTYSSYYLSCNSSKKNDININKTINTVFEYTETEQGSKVYTLKNTKFGLLLDISWDNGGFLTLQDGAGHTQWAFISEKSITDGSYARYKRLKTLYNLYKAIQAADALNDYKTEINAAYEVYSNTLATEEKIIAATRTLFNAAYGCLTQPFDASFMLKNPDMAGSASMADWATDSPAYGWGEFEKYHSSYSFEQDCTLPAGHYDVSLRSLYRQDGSDAAPYLSVKTTTQSTTKIPDMNTIDFGVANSSSNNWTKGSTYFRPDGMQSGGQALTHNNAIASIKDVVVGTAGTMTIKMTMSSGSQWINWQDVKLIYTGIGTSELRANLQTAYDEAVILYADGSGKKASELKSAIDEAKAAINNDKATSQILSSALNNLKSAMTTYRYANASIKNPINQTSLITNNNFEKQFYGWTNLYMQTQTNTVFSIKQGTTYVEKWTGRGGAVGDAEVSQQIKGLQMGIYQLKAAAQNIQEDTPNKKMNGAYIFANSDKTPVTTRSNYTLTFTNIEDDVTIGFLAQGAQGNWIACDNFTLYYVGGTDADFKAALKAYIDRADSLSKLHMHTATLNALVEAKQTAEGEYQSGSTSRYHLVSTPLRLASDLADVSISAYYLLLDAIKDAEATYAEKTLPGSPAYLEAINKAKDVYNDGTSSFDELSAQITALKEAKLAFLVSSPTGPIPVITTDSRTLRGSIMAFGRMTYNLKSAKLLEAGFCYSTRHNPDIFCQRSTRYHDNNGRIYIMDNMKPSTVYYARPYVITQGYQVAYGDELKIITLPKGQMTWSYNGGGDDATNERISGSCAHGIDIWNSLMSVKGFHLTANYSPGTPTADCSYGGWMRVGENASYQRTGTMLHEAAHGVGIGTENGWWTMLVNGQWTGIRANKVVQFWDNDKSATLKGDSQHMWPYGINGAHEDNGSDMLYYAQALIIQGLHEDGVAPTSGCFASAGYTFDQTDSVKYYIKNESSTFGLKTSYLTVSGTTLRWKQISYSNLIDDDAYAWYITFDPVTQLYSFQNVSTGQYITYNGGFKVVKKTGSVTTTEKMQLMTGRSNITVGTGSSKATFGSYWILRPNGGSATAMTGAANNSVSAAGFDLGTSASAQRWLILTEQQAQAFDKATDITTTPYQQTDDPSHDRTYNLAGQLVTPDHKGIIIRNGKKYLNK